MPHTRPRPFAGWLALTVILLIAIWLRLEGSMRLPLFLDEAFHIDWARRVLNGATYIGLRNNKFLYPVVMMPFALNGPEAAWLARALSALMGGVSLACVVSLGDQLGGRRTGMLAGLIYAALPLAVFHERQALVDPLMTTCTGLALVGMVRLSRRPGIAPGLALAVGLAGAYLTKVAALPYFALPFAAVLLLSPNHRIRVRALIGSAAAAALAGAAIWIVYQQAALEGVVPAAIYRVVPENVAGIGGGGDGFNGARLIADLRDYAETLWLYVTWPLLIAVAITAYRAVSERGRVLASILFLTVPAFGFALVPLLASRPAGGLAPRYLLACGIPLAVIAGMGIEWVLGLLTRKGGSRAAPTRAAARALIAAALIPALWFDGWLIAAPLRVHLPVVDEVQYQIGDPSGVGFDATARALITEWEAGGRESIHILGEGSWLQIAAYLGPRMGTFDGLKPGDADQRTAVARWLARGERVFVVYQGAPEGEEEPPHEARLALISSARHPSGESTLYEVTGAGGGLAAAIYAELGPAWDQLPGEFGALADALRAGDVSAQAMPEAITVIVYPPREASRLASETGRNVTALALDIWPPSADEAQRALAGIAAPGDGSLVEAVIVDPANTDPTRAVQMALHDQFYTVRHDWHGTLLRAQVVTGPAAASTEPAHVEYEGPIRLQEAFLLDPVLPPGGYARFILRWESPVTIRDSYSVFVHVVDSAGNLIAQQDGVPGAGLFPMPSWEPGEAITDRVAIRIPPDVPPGSYEVRVGIYLPGTDLRLGVLEAAEAGPGYAVIGRIEVAP